MKLHYRYALAAVLLIAASPAFATYCPNGTDHAGQGKPYYPNNCNDPPTTQPPNQHQTNTQDQNQHQGQGQGQGQNQTANGGAGGRGGNANLSNSGNSRNDVRNNNANTLSNSGNSSNRNNNRNTNNNAANATGGNSTSDSTAFGGESRSDASANNSGGNSAVNVDTSDRSVTNVAGSRTLFFNPGDLPANAMNIVAGAYITTAGDTECGVLVTKIRTPIYQWDKKGKHKREVGYDEDIAPYLDANGVQVDYLPVYTGNGAGYLRGSQVTYVLGSSGGSNSSQMGLQGYGGAGGGGISYGSGNAYSQAGVRLIIRPCIASRFEPKPAARPVVRKAKAKRRAVRRAPATCIPAQRICPAK